MLSLVMTCSNKQFRCMTITTHATLGRENELLQLQKIEGNETRVKQKRSPRARMQTQDHDFRLDLCLFRTTLSIVDTCICPNQAHCLTRRDWQPEFAPFHILMLR